MGSALYGCFDIIRVPTLSCVGIAVKGMIKRKKREPSFKDGMYSHTRAPSLVLFQLPTLQCLRGIDRFVHATSSSEILQVVISRRRIEYKECVNISVVNSKITLCYG